MFVADKIAWTNSLQMVFITFSDNIYVYHAYGYMIKGLALMSIDEFH